MTAGRRYAHMLMDAGVARINARRRELQERMLVLAEESALAEDGIDFDNATERRLIESELAKLSSRESYINRARETA